MSGGFDIEAKDYVYVEILVKGGVVLKTFGYPCQLVKTFPEETITESVAPQAQNEDAPIEKEAPLQESAKPQVGEDADPLSERAFSLLSHFGIGRGK